MYVTPTHENMNFFDLSVSHARTSLVWKALLVYSFQSFRHAMCSRHKICTKFHDSLHIFLRFIKLQGHANRQAFWTLSAKTHYSRPALLIFQANFNGLIQNRVQPFTVVEKFQFSYFIFQILSSFIFEMQLSLQRE